jgi:hypothetical protein
MHHGFLPALCLQQEWSAHGTSSSKTCCMPLKLALPTRHEGQRLRQLMACTPVFKHVCCRCFGLLLQVKGHAGWFGLHAHPNLIAVKSRASSAQPAAQYNAVHACTKAFAQPQVMDLALPGLGPYRLAFSRAGRHMLVGGARGHLAMLDWQAASPMCEIQVNDFGGSHRMGLQQSAAMAQCRFLPL